MIGRCWPLSHLEGAQDVFRMPDEDPGQLCIPWAAVGRLVMFGRVLGQTVMIGKL